MFKLTKHTKLALFVAPFLAVIGWIAGDIWVESQAMKKKVYLMKPDANYCDILAKQCILSAGEMQLSIYQEGNTTIINSTYPLDTATFFMVNDEDVSAYQMAMTESPYYWQRETTFAQLNSMADSKQRVRVIATVKGGQYIGEFVSTTLNTVK